MEPSPGTPPPVPTPAPVAPNGQNGPAAAVAAPVAAKETAPLFGGLRGGRKRKDGLVPGSPQALEADKKKDAERKRKQRQEDPAALPSALAAGPGQAQAPAAGVAPVPGVESAPAIPWTGEDLRPIWEELVPVAEEVCLNQVTKKCVKAKLPPQIVKEIEADAHWNPLGKKGLLLSGPEVSAELLNDVGISSKHKNKVVLASSFALIATSHLRLLRRLDQLIAAANPKPPRPAPDPAMGAAPIVLPDPERPAGAPPNFTAEGGKA